MNDTNSAIPSILETPFGSLAAQSAARALERPDHPAVVVDDTVTSYAELWAMAHRVAAAVQRDGLVPGDVAMICAPSSAAYMACYLGCLEAGVAVAPVSPSLRDNTLAVLVADSGAKLLFADSEIAARLAAQPEAAGVRQVILEGENADFTAWLAPEGAPVTPFAPRPESPFNLIYSSGTTGVPKGIMQPYSMRWAHLQRAINNHYGPDAVTLLGTPLYSNTTLVSALPTVALGGTLVLMRKFDAGRYLELAQRHRATHTMLVPVQYQRILAHPDFDSTDLSTFQAKFCTSAPFSAAMKSEVLRRWPGGLTEFYGMTEGGGSCILHAHQNPDKLHTVGQPAGGSVYLLLDEDGQVLPPGELGELVGHGPGMMSGYHNQPDKTAEVVWHDAEGRRYIRTGDMGRFDEDGFLVLMDRKKDMIISGGFNVYPSDIEAVLVSHPQVQAAAVVGVPSEAWGETPVAFVELREEGGVASGELMAWLNDQLEKNQRVAAVALVPQLPRSSIGKVLKRELRDGFAGNVR